MNYVESIAYIESLMPTVLDPTLERIALFMREMNDPQESYATIHVGGTNGKGSTCAILDSVLRAAGLKVGRFTGPHLLRWNERFHVNGEPIPEDRFAQLVTTIREQSLQFGQRHPEMGPLTWFEFLTALAFIYFAEECVDVAVIEVGLGGRWDATNILKKPVVTAVTTVDLDHTQILGNTVAEIAREKAGIAKAGVPMVTGTTGDALEVIRRRTIETGSELVVCNLNDEASGYSKRLPALSLVGQHQRLNAAIAYECLRVFERQTGREVLKAVPTGFKKVYWPARFQYLAELRTVVDGAHNVAGAHALRSAIDQFFPNTPISFVMSFYRNKDAHGFLDALVRPTDLVYVSEAAGTRAVHTSQDIVQYLASKGVRATSFDTIAAAHEAALSGLQRDRVIVLTGSFASAKECFKAWGWQTVEDGITQSRFDWTPGCTICL